MRTILWYQLRRGEVDAGHLYFGGRTKLTDGFKLSAPTRSGTKAGLKGTRSTKDSCKASCLQACQSHVQPFPGPERARKPRRTVAGASARGTCASFGHMQRSLNRALGGLSCPGLPRHVKVTPADFAPQSFPVRHALGPVGGGRL